MAHTEAGRNDPCPCGSGRKFKHCCLGRTETSAASNPATEFLEEVRQAIEGRRFGSNDELQAFVREMNERRNGEPQSDFCGLSPEQMHRFLWFPFDTPELVDFPSCLDSPPSAPILTLFQFIADAIGEKGLKPTATGNLPRKLVQEAAVGYPADEMLSVIMQRTGIRTETDFDDLHAARIVGEVAGLIRKYRGRFILGRDCRRIMTGHGLAGIYPWILSNYAGRFNWGYRDGYHNLDFIQESFLFTLYLLHCFGGDWRSNAFYEDSFLRAFPTILQKAEPCSYITPEDEVRHCYSRRCLEHFTVFLGLAEIKPGTHQVYPHCFELRKLPLLDLAVKFNL